jgi:hypothetical protein
MIDNDTERLEKLGVLHSRMTAGKPPSGRAGRGKAHNRSAESH